MSDSSSKSQSRKSRRKVGVTKRKPSKTSSRSREVSSTESEIQVKAKAILCTIFLFIILLLIGVAALSSYVTYSLSACDTVEKEKPDEDQNIFLFAYQQIEFAVHYIFGTKSDAKLDDSLCNPVCSYKSKDAPPAYIPELQMPYPRPDYSC